MTLRYKDWKIRYKILLAAIMPFILAALITMPMLADSIISTTEYRAKLYADKLAYGLSLIVGLQTERYINEVIESSEVFSAVSNHGVLNDATINQILSRSTKQNKDFEGVWAVLEPHGQLANNATYWRREVDDTIVPVKLDLDHHPLIDELVAKSKQSRAISMAIEQRAEKHNLLMIAHPIIDGQNNYIGSVGLNVHLGAFVNILQEAQNYGIAGANLLDAAGAYITSSTPSPKDATPATLQAIAKLLGSSIPLDAIHEISPENNYDIYIPIRFLGTTNAWVLHASYPLDPGHREVYANVALMGSIFLMCLVIGVSVSIVTARTIASPIQKISEALSKITEGDFHTDIPEVDAGDEVGRIAKAAVVFSQYSYDLLTAKKEAESANLAKTEFLSNMSHELRTPMHAILSYAKLGLQKAKLDATLKKYLTNISASGERLLSLLNDLLDLAKLEAGKVIFHFVPSDINTCIKEVLAELNPLIAEKKLAVSVQLLERHSVISFDREKFAQVLINIVSNAIKFSEKAGKIKISLSQHNSSHVIIVIQDEGIGIPMEDIDDIFDKFTQSSKTNKGSGGTGLGLSIAKSIVTAHGGKIWAESKPGLGATFKIILPIHQSNRQLEDM